MVIPKKKIKLDELLNRSAQLVKDSSIIPRSTLPAFELSEVLAHHNNPTVSSTTKHSRSSTSIAK